jgi:hypothetical protein
MPLHNYFSQGGNSGKNILDKYLNSNYFIYYYSIFLFTIVSIALFNSFLCDKHLSGDGAYFFYSILETKDFSYYSAWSRFFWSLLTQWPLVLAVNIGITDINNLKIIYALGLYYPYVFSFLLCIYALRGLDGFLLIFPIFSMIAINLNVDYQLVSEVNLMVCMSWPILFYLRREKYSALDKIFILILLILYCRIYESVIVTSFIFIGIILFRFLFFKDKKPLVFYFTVILICLISIFIAFHYIVHPENPANKKAFLNSLLSIYFFPEVYIPTIFMAILVYILFKKKVIYQLILAIPVLWYLLILFSNDHGLSQYSSFSIRSASISLLPILLIICFILSFLKLHHNRTILLIYFLFVLIFTSGNVYYSKDWKSFKKNVIQITQENIGFVPVEKTPLNTTQCGWAWTYPELSIIWSTRCVKSIILNNPDVKWQPYDPQRKLILKRYVQYDKYFLSIDPNINVCVTNTSIQ